MQTTTKDLLASAVKALASVCDGAHADDGHGFNGVDAPFAHSVCEIPPEYWSFKVRNSLYLLLKKYTKQLQRYGINYADIPKPRPDDGLSYDKEKARAEREAKKKAEDEARAKAGIPAKRVRLEGERFELVFPYSEQVKEGAKHQLNARWDKTAKVWWVPVSLAGVQQLKDFAAAWQFGFETAAEERINAMVEQAQALYQTSRAEDAELHLEGFGREDYQPRPFQRAGIVYAVQAMRTFIADDMGLGKTIQGLATLWATQSFPAVFVTKATLKVNTYNECIKAYGDTKNIRIIEGRTDGTAPHTCNVDQSTQLDLFGEIRCEACRFEMADLYVINYDILADGWEANSKKRVKLTPAFQAIIARGIKALVFDESQMAKNEEAQRTVALIQFAEEHKPPVRLALTGTPCENRPKEFIAQLRILGRLDEFGGSWKFKQRYCDGHQKYVPGRGMVWDFAGSSNSKELNEKLRSTCYVRRLKKDVLKELPPKVRTVIPVEITNRADYEKAERELIEFVRKLAMEDAQARAQAMIDLNGDEEAVEAYMRRRANDKAERAKRAQTLVKINVLRQQASKGKLKAVVDWISDFQETGNKLVVFAFYKETQREILSAFPHFAHVFGEDSPEDRAAAVKRFQEDPACMGIVCSLMAAAEGITLTAASDVLVVERPWTPSKQDQAEDRCHRIGQHDSVTAWYFDGINTIDEDLHDLIEGKRSTLEAAMDGEVSEAPTSVIRDLLNKTIARAS